jgi:hypothetical protein
MPARPNLGRIDPVTLPEGPIGLLSDAHGDARMARRGVAALVAAGARSLLYLGDVCGDGVIDALAGVTDPQGGPIPARLVFGNMDFDTGPLTAYCRSLGVGVDHPCGLYRCGASTLVATHGHLRGFEDAALALPADYFLHGHTHLVRDERAGPTRLCNPGALHRARRLTVGVLDCAADSFRIITVG